MNNYISYIYNMKKLTINLPDSVDLSPEEVTTALAAQLYEMGKLSLGQAAELAGYEKKVFMELLGNYGVSVFNFPAGELDHDINNAKRHHI
jgi:predicted HTH domain antitoxin